MRMRFKKVLLSMFLLSLAGSSVIFAGTAVNKLRVTLNGSVLSESAIIMDDTAYVPLREVAKHFFAFVSWGNNKQVQINRPNIHMMTISGSTIFQGVEKGSTVTFYVLVHGEKLTTPISDARMVIVDPYNSEKEIYAESNPENVDVFRLRTKDVKYKFSHPGEYKIRLYMKPEGGNDWFLVSEKTIYAQ